jgi:hypothetical protein
VRGLVVVEVPLAYSYSIAIMKFTKIVILSVVNNEFKGKFQRILDEVMKIQAPELINGSLRATEQINYLF